MIDALYEEKILILDYGSQYTQLIARRVRELGVYSEVLPCDVNDAVIIDKKPAGIILSGGPNSVHIEDEHLPVPAAVFDLGVPVLGICYGMQIMAQQLGGEVKSANEAEFGNARVCVTKANVFIGDVQDDTDQSGRALLDVWMSHGDSVQRVPDGFEVIGSSDDCAVAMMMHPIKQWYGLQFHPEVTHTKQGAQLLARFIHTICGCDSGWTMSNIIESSLEQIKNTVGHDHVLLGLSGGVDSSVLAALIYRAIGKQLVAVFVDNGLLRQGEAEAVKTLFEKHMGMRLVVVDAREQFLQALKGVCDPEAKRKVIGEQFIRVFEATARDLGDIQWLAQGTIYPDVIESAKHEGSNATVIKSHHNVGGLPDDMQLKLLEPLRMCFKDEVRVMGEELGLPHDLVYRHPFPGPGLGVRILGEIQQEFIEILKQADHIFLEELRAAGLYNQVSQAFAVFLPVRSVGVKGDKRSYDYVIALRSVDTIDFMTAHFSRLPYDLLGKVAERIMNEVKHVSRVVFDISSKPPSTIEWE